MSSRHGMSANRRQRRRRNLLGLPDDVLFVIFSKCDTQSLGRLCSVCRKLNTLLQLDSSWLRFKSDFQIIGTDNPVLAKTRLKEKYRISLNWTKAVFNEQSVLRFKKRQLPWIQYQGQTIWVSTQNNIQRYGVSHDGMLTEEPSRNPAPLNGDVTKFTVKGDRIVSGCRDGSVYLYDSKTGQSLIHYNRVHETDSQAVDVCGSCIISGSRDHTVKILLSNVDEGSYNNSLLASVDVGDRVWSLGFTPSGRSFTVGTAGCNDTPAISVWDTETVAYTSLGENRYGAGVLDQKFEDEHTLLSCGYDATLRMWDLRTGQCVLKWEEPYDNTLYCLQSDQDVTIVTGTSRYGMVRLWDKRKSQPVQLYYLGRKNSPVFSVACDTSRLYAALDLSITMADFSNLWT